VSRLGDTFRIVSLDMPGHGLTGAIPSGDYSLKSMSETVVQTADRLGLGKFAIAGNSMGGAVAARVAEDHPDRVSALILVDAGGMAQKMGQHIPIGFRIARTPLLNQLMLYITPRQVFDEGLRDSFAHQERVTAAMVTEYWELNRMDGTRQASLQRFRMPFDTYVRDHIAQIKAPTLILWGAKDNLIPVSAAHEYAARIEGARLIIFPDAGHVLQEDDPDQSAAAARSFLTSLPH
jgi:pimeloyl-ACP methyl ester carboxylesterase